MRNPGIDEAAERAAVRRQAALLEPLTAAERVRMQARLTRSVARLAFRALAASRPGCADADLRIEFLRLRYGEVVADGFIAWNESRA